MNKQNKNNIKKGFINKNKNNKQKRTIISNGFSTIGGMGLVTILIYFFLGGAFSLVILGFGIDSLGSGGLNDLP